jgi:hypothetical protein
MANQDDTHDANGSRNNVEKEIKRGLTVMKSIIRARDKGVKFEVHWSAEDQLIEPNGSMLASYIGFLVRQHIPITCDNLEKSGIEGWQRKNMVRDTGTYHILLYVFFVDYLLTIYCYNITYNNTLHVYVF